MTATDHLRHRLARDPADGPAWRDHAILGHVGDAPPGDVVAGLRRAGVLDPDQVLTWTRGAQIHFDQGLFADGVRAGRIAACLAPGDAEAIHAMAEALAAADGPGAALPWLERLVALAPDIAVYRLTRGMKRLGAGIWRRGWSDYEARRVRPGMKMPPDEITPLPSAALAGRTLLVQHEQGFGDTIQFMRFLPGLLRHGARVQLAVPAALRGLAADLQGAGGMVLIDPDDVPGARVDLALPIMSLPALLGLMPDGAPYLAASAARRARWAAAVTGLPGLRVGLCWSGDPRPDAAVNVRMTDRRRSIPLGALAAITAVEGATFISLQHRCRAGEDPGACGIRDVSAHIDDFSDLAGLIANLDLVITVDTAVAHLAGALGARTWMLNRFDSCWRWERGSATTRWYDTMTIFNQATPMDWSAPLAEVAAALRTLVGGQRDWAGG